MLPQGHTRELRAWAKIVQVNPRQDKHLATSRNREAALPSERLGLFFALTEQLTRPGDPRKALAKEHFMYSGTGIDKELQADVDREWLETNGLGDFASSTAAGIHTRRYHGLLVANIEHMDRHVLLSALEDWICRKNESIPLSGRYHPGCVYPNVQQCLARFAASPCPTYTYRMQGLEITKSVALVHMSHTVLVRYQIRALDKQTRSENIILRITPLLAFRFFHALTHANMDLHVKTYPAEYGFKIQPYNALPPLFMQAEGLFDFLPSPEWINRVEYPMERERGFDYSEDLFAPGLFEIHVVPGDDIIVSASTAELPLHSRGLRALWDEEMARRQKTQTEVKNRIHARAHSQSQLLPFLASQMEDFLYTTSAGKRLLLAGYPWFGSWGRDTLIALPGATFLAGRVDEGLEILSNLAASARDGIIPNTFDGDGYPNGWNSVDASLWFAWDCQLLLKALGRDREKQAAFLDICAPAVYNIISAFRMGRVPFARVASSGLLETGTPQTQLTWMDAQVDGKPVTPRNGYPVEIQALWYNTLAFAHKLAKKRNDPDPCPSRELNAIASQFAAKFVLPDGTLCDVWRAWEDGGQDTALRPNQLIAVALPEAIAPRESWRPIVEKVRDKLLTPYGPRTLSPDDRDFCPTYGGGIAQRDGAYHQGTVWPWLLGVYTDALIRVLNLEEAGKSSAKPVASSEKAAAKAKPQALTRGVKDLLKTIQPLVTTHLTQAGIGHISEVFSATEPYAPGGSIAQAWSEAEVYRSLLILRAADRESFEAWEKGLKLFAIKKA